LTNSSEEEKKTKSEPEEEVHEAVEKLRELKGDEEVLSPKRRKKRKKKKTPPEPPPSEIQPGLTVAFWKAMFTIIADRRKSEAWKLSDDEAVMLDQATIPILEKYAPKIGVEVQFASTVLLVFWSKLSLERLEKSKEKKESKTEE